MFVKDLIDKIRLIRHLGGVITKNKIALIVLDGWGVDRTWAGNAIALSDTPNFDKLKNDFPNALLAASGEAVGLPFQEPGNSEVGHLNLGTGQPVSQGLTDINQKINDGSFFNNPVLVETIEHTKKNQSCLHIIGLLSDGGIHSHIDHLFALLKFLKKQDQTQVFLHLFTDGRDSSPTSSPEFIRDLDNVISELNLGIISTIVGRYYAMDRDRHWDRIELAYNAITKRVGKKAETAEEAISNSYADGITDEFITPYIIDGGKPIEDNDSVIFYNFRSDRARQISESLIGKDFTGFKRTLLKNIFLATFASYQEGLEAHVIFKDQKIKNPLASVFAQNSLSHLHVAETEKYAHVTYFFNGGEERPFANEKRILVPSPKVPTYDLKPEMSAAEITKKVLPLIGEDDFLVLNFANVDMVGHTGDFVATQKAIEEVDKNLGILIEKLILKNVITFITADHGNAERMIDPLTGLEDTEHTENPVPLILVSKILKDKKLPEDGRLADIAPTILNLLGLKPPAEMTGKKLF